MLAINLFLALFVVIPIWYLGSRGLAELIFRTETVRPQVTQNPAWSAFETVSNLFLFFGAVALWVAVTYLLQ